MNDSIVKPRSPLDLAFNQEQTPSEGEIAAKLNEFMDDVSPGMSPQEKAESQIIAGQVLDGKASSPTIENTKAAFSQPGAQNNPEIVMKAKAESGESVTESMGALLSLVLPVLAGATIGGTRGAAHAVVGGGTQLVKQLERADEEDRANRLADKAYDRKVDFEGVQQEGRVKVEETRAAQRQTLDDKVREKKALSRASGQASNLKDAEKDHQASQGFLEAGRAILEDFGEKTKGEGWAGFQIKRTVSATEIGQLQLRVKGLVFDIVKAKQGSRPSDFDVQALMKIVTGDFTAGPETAYTLLKNALNDSETFVNARLNAAQAAFDGRDLTKEESASIKAANRNTLLQDEMQKLGTETLKALLAIRQKSSSLKDIEKALTVSGKVVSNDLLSSMGFK